MKNMRELKFRVWDIEKDRFIEECSHRIIFQSSAADIVGHIFAADLSKYKIQQFTGLLDKNSKDIYEGDIVKYKHWNGSFDHDSDYVGYVSEVKFVNGEFIPRERNIDWEDPWYNWRDYDFEILGNIFENPELLNNP